MEQIIAIISLEAILLQMQIAVMTQVQAQGKCLIYSVSIYLMLSDLVVMYHMYVSCLMVNSNITLLMAVVLQNWHDF